MLHKWLRTEQKPCPDTKASWFQFQLRVGDFRLEADKESRLAIRPVFKESRLAIRPVFPVVMRGVWRILLLSAAFAGGIGAADMDTKLCDQLGNPSAPIVEELSPRQ